MSKAKLLLVTLMLFNSIAHEAISQSNSVLANGTWIKLAIDNTGLYKLTYADFQSYGLDAGSIDPATIRLFGNGSGMLPQANSDIRPIDLNEISIVVVGQDDASFDPGDYVIFFGQGPDKLDFDSISNSFSYQNHLFSELNYYYLNVSQSLGKRITTSPTIAGGVLTSSAYNAYVHEVDLFNILHSGRQWFGEKFDLETSQSFSTGVTNIEASSTIKVISAVMSASQQNSSFKLSINGTDIGSLPIAANPQGTYATKGTVAKDTFMVSKGTVSDNPLELTYTFEKEFGIGYLDYFILQTKNVLQYTGAPLMFYTGDLTNSGNITFSVTDCPENMLLWDITNHNNVSQIDYSQSGTIITFNASIDNKKFLLFNPVSELVKPIDNEVIENQNLHGTQATDLLIITPPLFESYANNIAQLRESEGLSVKVVLPTQVYNEFSSGKPDISAIRDYAKYIYDNGGLKYLLMFGKGTYDPTDILESELNHLVIYESRNSLQPLATYGSDDYLGFLEDDEGEWAESRSGDHTMDIGVGRIPAITEAEANNYIDKLINYRQKGAIGAWRKEVTFVAENGDQNLHQRDAERLATLIDTTYAAFNTNKIYVDAFPIEVNPGTKRAPLVNEEIYNTIHNGSLIINYTGHGNENQWAKTRIFDKNVIDSLLNKSYLPLFVTATCEFGRHDDTSERSGGEDLIIKYNTGAIAIITTARPVFSSTNYQLSLAFYSEIFEQPNGKFQRLGDIFRKTKNNSLSGVLNRSFSLLGDPSLRLSFPDQSITIDSLNGSVISNQDTLSTLQELNFSGTVRLANQAIDNTFNGDLEITILDKTTTNQTLGNLGATPFKYSVRNNALYRGKASIKGGLFSFTTVLPRDISYNPASAKFTLYAQKNDSSLDASGANIDMLIGNSSTNPIVDSTAPLIQLYLGDTSYVEGRVVSPSSLLIAKISDDFGVNLSTNQVGHSISYSLDYTESVVLNDFYSSVKDNFKKGWLYYNLPLLSPGKHTLSLTAWDTSNNSSTASLVFNVSENGQIIISELSNYPNPMRESTNFTFAHNLSGEELEVTLQIINTSGQNIYQQTRSYIAAPSVIDDWYWDGRNTSGGKLNGGIYLYGIIIRSKTSNLTQTRYSRLFITN